MSGLDREKYLVSHQYKIINWNQNGWGNYITRVNDSCSTESVEEVVKAMYFWSKVCQERTFELETIKDKK